LSPILGSARGGGKIEASTQCCRELSACCVVAVLRMLLSHWYTLPNLLVEGVGNVSRSAATMATFWLALVKVGSCYSACSITTVQPASNVESRRSSLPQTSISLVSTTTRSSANPPLCHVASHSMYIICTSVFLILMYNCWRNSPFSSLFTGPCTLIISQQKSPRSIPDFHT
jgi:hypothetical protein